MDRTSSTVAETTRFTDEISTTKRDPETIGTTTDARTTSYGTTSSTSMMTTPGRTTQGRTTPAIVTRTHSTWPASTTTQQQMETTVGLQETTHFHTPSTPEAENEIEHIDNRDNKVETDAENELEPENEHEHTGDVDSDSHLPAPEPEPPYYPLPPPTVRPKNRNGGRITTEAEERTAMIIGIVAGALIAVILVILLLLWLKSNGDRTYKTDHDKGMAYGHGPNAALLGNAANAMPSRHHNLNGSNAPLNGSMRNGSDKVAGPLPGLVPQKPKKRDSKDIKEWYV